MLNLFDVFNQPDPPVAGLAHLCRGSAVVTEDDGEVEVPT